MYAGPVWVGMDSLRFRVQGVGLGFRVWGAGFTGDGFGFWGGNSRLRADWLRVPGLESGDEGLGDGIVDRGFVLGGWGLGASNARASRRERLILHLGREVLE